MASSEKRLVTPQVEKNVMQILRFPVMFVDVCWK